MSDAAQREGKSIWRARMRLWLRRVFASTPRLRPVLGTRGALFEDLAATWRMRELCFLLAFQRSTSRLRRTFLGPAWIILSFVIMTLGLAWFWAEIVGRPFELYFPWVTLGFYFWNFVTGAITEGARALQDSRGLVLQTQTPLAMYPVVAVLKQGVAALYNLPYVVGVLVLYAPMPDVAALLVIPGIFLVTIVASAAALMLAVWCAYVPDLVELIAASMRFLFFLTPIIWMPAQRASIESLIQWNPLYHMINVVRGPLLQTEGVLVSMSVCAVIGVAAWIAAGTSYYVGAGAVSTRI